MRELSEVGEVEEGRQGKLELPKAVGEGRRRKGVKGMAQGTKLVTSVSYISYFSKFRGWG